MITSDRVRDLLAKHGELRQQEAADWTGEFPLSGSLVSFYREVGPVDVTIPGYGNPYFLPSLAGLWAFQEGYRWNSISHQRLDDWPDNWLVVADEGGDPFILDRSSERVLLAQHGTGTWEPEDLFENVREMAGCLAAVGSVVVEAGPSLTDDTAYLRPENRLRAERRVREVVGSQDRAAAVLAALGWA